MRRPRPRFQRELNGKYILVFSRAVLKWLISEEIFGSIHINQIHLVACNPFLEENVARDTFLEENVENDQVVIISSSETEAHRRAEEREVGRRLSSSF